MTSLSTKAGIALSDHVRETYIRAPGHLRNDILKNFVGWAYAHRHDIPRREEEADALALVFETFLNDRKHDGWLKDFQRMNRARQGRGRFWRAEHWWRAYKTMKRTLPMLAVTTAGEIDW